MLLAQSFPGMEYIPLILLCLAVGYLVGLSVILLALLRYVKLAQKLAIGLILFATMTTFIFAMLLGDPVNPAAHAITMSPAGLGLVAILIALLT
ncbi:hypothetical protein [Blastopirellula marina]|uniref:Uncharacterized protein n=1 Tax=Blastopirellula marina TaxID=124 RepID=A0A2S8GLC0_9BACT|nr:hypothetical protein [Blastopirellula marina]PQO45232.1 hypothetical protein C5Y93_14815 [Blastopirellula marina]